MSPRDLLARALPALPLAGLTAALVLLAILASRRREPPVDPYAEHEPATSYDPAPKPGTRALRSLVISRFGERLGSPENISRWDRTDRPSEHHEGRAWDLMVTSPAHGQAVVDWLLAPDPVSGEPHAAARRAGVMYVIWAGRMWRAYPWAGHARGAWTPYTGENPHRDHVHVSLSRRGAAGETSLYA